MYISIMKGKLTGFSHWKMHGWEEKSGCNMPNWSFKNIISAMCMPFFPNLLHSFVVYRTQQMKRINYGRNTCTLHLFLKLCLGL